LAILKYEVILALNHPTVVQVVGSLLGGYIINPVTVLDIDQVETTAFG